MIPAGTNRFCDHDRFERPSIPQQPPDSAGLASAAKSVLSSTCTHVGGGVRRGIGSIGGLSLGGERSLRHPGHAPAALIGPAAYAVYTISSAPPDGPIQTVWVPGEEKFAAIPRIPCPSHYDLVVIGSGPAGQKAALNAAKLGKRVALDRARSTASAASASTPARSRPRRSAKRCCTSPASASASVYGDGYAVKQDITMADLLVPLPPRRADGGRRHPQPDGAATA